VTQPSPNGSKSATKPAFDPVNPYQGIVPTEWTMDTFNPPQGQFAAVCFRTPNTTMTVVLAKDDLSRLIGMLQQLHAGMHGLIIPG
jgi:hypothetical protein